MHPDLLLRARAKEMLDDLIDGNVIITHVWFDLATLPVDGAATAWYLQIKTTKHYQFTFHMEGTNIAAVREAIDTDGRRLVDPASPLNPLSAIPGPRLADLDQTVFSALAQILPS